MRKVTTALLSLALGFTLAAPALAGDLVAETFTYPDGNLSGNGGWAVYSGTPPTDIQVLLGRAVGSHSNAPDDHLLFTPQAVDVKTYACFNVRVTDPGAAPKAVYFALLKDAGTSNFVSRVYVLPLISGGWTFGISHSSTSATGAGITPWSASSLNYGQEYQIVINYDPVAKSSTLWVDPASEASTSVTDVNAAIAALAVQGVGLRQSGTASAFPANPIFNAGTANWVFSVDNLGVGTSFSAACTSDPTPNRGSTWGQIKTLYR